MGRQAPARRGVMTSPPPCSAPPVQPAQSLPVRGQALHCSLSRRHPSLTSPLAPPPPPAIRPRPQGPPTPHLPTLCPLPEHPPPLTSGLPWCSAWWLASRHRARAPSWAQCRFWTGSHPIDKKMLGVAARSRPWSSFAETLSGKESWAGLSNSNLSPAAHARVLEFIIVTFCHRHVPLHA